MAGAVPMGWEAFSRSGGLSVAGGLGPWQGAGFVAASLPVAVGGSGVGSVHGCAGLYFLVGLGPHGWVAALCSGHCEQVRRLRANVPRFFAPSQPPQDGRNPPRLMVSRTATDAKPGDRCPCTFGSGSRRIADFRRRVDFGVRGIENPGPRVDFAIARELTNRLLSGMLRAFPLGGTSMSPSIIAISADDAGRTSTV